MKKQEKPKPFGGRLYKKQKDILTRWAKKVDVSEATVNRAAIEFFNNWQPTTSITETKQFIKKFE